MSAPNPCEIRKPSSFQKIGKMLVVGCFLVAAYYGYNAHKEMEPAQAKEESVRQTDPSESGKAASFLKEDAGKDAGKAG